MRYHPLALVSALIALVVLAFLNACSVPPPKSVPGAAIVTPSGTAMGTSQDERVVQWFDIPFAEPPVGDLRWRAPRPLNSTDKVIAQRQEQVMCVQMPSETSATAGSAPIGTEDCLYLDITAPADFASNDYPVMFWIHGGGNTAGHKGTYDFTELVAQQNVVVVTFNYRLGPLGWMTHPALQGAANIQQNPLDASSNFGTLDIIAALTWTQQNIALFGGNPNNVTIFGESAGGHNVYALLASPLTTGLFHKAIAQSGYVATVSPREAVNREREFAQIDRGSWEVIKALDLDPNSVDGQALRKVSADDLLEAYYSLEKDHLAPLSTTDGIVLPEDGLLAAFADPARAKQVPVLSGSNRDEVTLWLGLNRYFVDGSKLLFGLLPPKLEIKNPELYHHWVSLRSQAWKTRGVDEPLAAMAAGGSEPLYAYRFDWDEQDDNWFFPFSEILGAAHGTEIAFVMGGPMYGSIGDYMYPDTESAQDMTATMMQAWGNFARTGKPGKIKGEYWPEYRAAAPHTMILDSGDQSRVMADSTTTAGLLQEAAQPSPLNATERCILVWEMLTNIGEPSYSRYQRWNDGECSEVDARAEKLAAREALKAEYGSASLP